MTRPTEDDQRRYLAVMAETRDRLDEVERLLFDEDTRDAYRERVPNRWDLEYAALQLRTVIELVALSSLAANREAVARIKPTFHREGYKKTVHKVREVNAEFWPQPVQFMAEFTDRVVMGPKRDPYLTERDAWDAWGRLSEYLLHAANPYGEQRPEMHDFVVETWGKLHNLLPLHFVTLAGSTEAMLFTEHDRPHPSKLAFATPPA